MSVKYKILNLDKVLKKIEDLFDSDVRNDQLMNDIGEFTKLRIQAETRRGKDLTQGFNVKQPRLADSTIRIRQLIAQGKIKSGNKFYFKPDKTFFDPSTSNLTASGQMLESLKEKVTKKGEVIVEPTGSRDNFGNVDSSIKTNKALAIELANRRTENAPRGRTFLGLDEKGIKRIKKLILDEVRRFKRRRGFR